MERVARIKNSNSSELLAQITSGRVLVSSVA
jgi:hypothetical protein